LKIYFISIISFSLYINFLAVNKGLQCVEDYYKISGPNACQVKAHSKPWIVSLRQKQTKRQWCAGTLIASKLVLTAAHCICKSFPICAFVGNCNLWEISPNCTKWKNSSVIAGDHDLEQIDDGEQEIDVKYGHAHEKWRQSM
jgi:hypothetical protein